MPKLSVLACEHDVAMADELGAAGETVTMHLRDRGLVNRPQPLPSLDRLMQSEPIVGDSEGRAGMLRALQIVTRRKRAACTADDQHARVGIGLVLIHHRVEFLEQL